MIDPKETSPRITKQKDGKLKAVKPTSDPVVKPVPAGGKIPDGYEALPGYHPEFGRAMIKKEGS